MLRAARFRNLLLHSARGQFLGAGVRALTLSSESSIGLIRAKEDLNRVHRLPWSSLLTHYEEVSSALAAGAAEDASEVLMGLNEQLRQRLYHREDSDESDDSIDNICHRFKLILRSVVVPTIDPVNSALTERADTVKCLSQYIAAANKEDAPAHLTPSPSTLDLLDTNHSSKNTGTLILFEPFSIYHCLSLLNELRDVTIARVDAYSLDVVNDAEREILSLLSILSGIIRKNHEILAPSEISQALHALKNKSSNHREVRKIFGSLVGKLINVEEGSPWKPNLIENCANSLSEMDCSDNVVLKGVKRISGLIGHTDKEEWTIDNVMHCLRTLSNMTAKSRDVQAYLSSLNSVLQEKLKNTTEYPFSSIAQGMCGMQKMTCQSLEAKDLLNSITELVQRSTLEGPRAGHDVALMLSGMKSMSPHHVEVYALCDALSKKISNIRYRNKKEYSEGGFTEPENLTKMISSLSNFSSDFYATSDLLMSIAKQHKNACVALGSSDLSIADLLEVLSGMRAMSNSKVKVKFFVETMVDSALSNGNKHSRNGPNVTAYSISNAMIGLRGMSNKEDFPDLICILDAIIASLQKLNESRAMEEDGHPMYSFTSKTFSVAMQGLQGLSCHVNSPNQQKIVELIDSLYDAVSKEPSGAIELVCVQNMDLSHCCRTLFGLLNIHHDCSPSILAIKSDLLKRIEEILPEKFESTDDFKHKQVISNTSELLELQRVLSFYASKYKEGGSPLVDSLLQLKDRVNQIVGEDVVIEVPDKRSSSVLERRFRKSLKDELLSFAKSHELEDVRLQSNVNIRGFDVDILVSFAKNGVTYCYNLEIDGPHHMRPHKQHFFNCRDEFLLESKLVHDIRRLRLFGGNPAKTKIISRGARQRIVQSELRRMAGSANAYFEKMNNKL